MTRIKFASGLAAGAGVIVLSLFFLLGFLGVVGVGVGIATKQIHADGGELAMYAVFVIAVALWGASIVRDLRAVRVVEVGGDGAWTLRGPLGIPRGSIAAGTPRTLRPRSTKVWIFGAPRRYEQTWVEIEAGGRRWRTCGSIPEITKPALAQLERARR